MSGIWPFPPEKRTPQRLVRESRRGQLCWRLKGNPSSSAASPGWFPASWWSSCCSPSWRSRRRGRTGRGGQTWPRWCKPPGRRASNPNRECSASKPGKVAVSTGAWMLRWIDINSWHWRIDTLAQKENDNLIVSNLLQLDDFVIYLECLSVVKAARN